jgi:hypothetical protein
MDHLIEVLDLEIRIATTAAVRAQLEAERMREDRVEVTCLGDERRLRALVDELITLRARQLDGFLPTQTRRHP